MLIAQPGPDIGLCFFGARGFGDFVLRLQFRIEAASDNSGVFVRFRDPRLPAPDLEDARAITNPAWIAVHTGFEIQIDERSREGWVDRHRTGAVYDIPTADGHHAQTYSRGSALQPGRWNDYEITVSGDSYQVRLNDHVTAVYANADRRPRCERRPARRVWLHRLAAAHRRRRLPSRANPGREAARGNTLTLWSDLLRDRWPVL